MLFNIEQDAGDALVFYIVPDDYSSTPRCRLFSDGRDIGCFEANEERSALVAAGRHETGLCGFRITSADIPGLCELSSLSIHDERTEIKVYSRPNASHLQRRVIRLDTHLLPLWRFDQILQPHFQYGEAAIDRQGRETVTQMFLVNECSSVYLSGRILFRNYAYYIDKGFDVLTVLQAPHAEFVERLRILSLVKSLGGQHLGERDQMRLAPAIEFASSLDFQDLSNFQRRLRQMPGDVELLLAEPLTRQLTVSAPDDMPVKGSVAMALDVLANCRLIGFRDCAEDFAAAVAQYLQAHDGRGLVAAIPNFDPIQPLAASLQQARTVDHLIEHDLDIFDQVKKAYDAASVD
jgi:hypothetical protein